MISQTRRNPLAHKILSRHATDDERCKLGGHQRVFGHFGVQNAGNLDISRHAWSQPVRPLVSSSARGIGGGPRRLSEVLLIEQSLPVAGSSRVA